MIQASQADHIGKAVSWLIVGVVGGALIIVASGLFVVYRSREISEAS